MVPPRRTWLLAEAVPFKVTEAPSRRIFPPLAFSASTSRVAELTSPSRAPMSMVPGATVSEAERSMRISPGALLVSSTFPPRTQSVPPGDRMLLPRWTSPPRSKATPPSLIRIRPSLQTSPLPRGWRFNASSVNAAQPSPASCLAVEIASPATSIRAPSEMSTPCSLSRNTLPLAFIQPSMRLASPLVTRLTINASDEGWTNSTPTCFPISNRRHSIAAVWLDWVMTSLPPVGAPTTASPDTSRAPSGKAVAASGAGLVCALASRQASRTAAASACRAATRVGRRRPPPT